METKSLAFAIVGFLFGGLVVSFAATQLDEEPSHAGGDSGMTMGQMSEELRDITGDEYDAAFIVSMIEHHQGAVEMAKLSAERAKHPEIKQLSEDIVAAQEREIAQMERWQEEWGYDAAER